MFGFIAKYNFTNLRLGPSAVFRALESTLATSVTASSSACSQLVKYPYFVRRTRFQSLPVYRDIKNGNTRKLTVIRRIEGDLEALRSDLTQTFGPDTQITVKKLSQQLVIKGDCKRSVQEWLTKKGF
ncbi:mitochondrial large ribosomal subunit [Coemansia asiatica]|uniref:Large ribosomal subunit protein mL49 n=1 Tax=Coemansia asiatica TaxID=1052880 RepID=A0A9W7XHR2_9FUNG|nr:mitochondrial large ribosomal subunit [Coemansia asiatica]